MENIVTSVFFDRVLAVLKNAREQAKTALNISMVYQSFQEQSTVSSRNFEDCVFEKVRIEADLTFQPNRVVRCRFADCDLYMNSVNRCEFKDMSFESVTFKCALLSNRFERVRFAQCEFSPKLSYAQGNCCVECERDGEAFVMEKKSY